MILEGILAKINSIFTLHNRSSYISRALQLFEYIEWLVDRLSGGGHAVVLCCPVVLPVGHLNTGKIKLNL